ncbi:hypothetical protein [Plebeiibacterium sediminum]|uniref:Uncharacterized protein n=1 Tax=Plebeiibacterium sediminum TaxID=2992112 RepID=A0AAE3M0U5_9BACT|nr:hypothetical protein [Plebeiobacterium sediminum]MCW3784943.1 hypothetical protein [Plebeiobacterium sediminum]
MLKLTIYHSGKSFTARLRKNTSIRIKVKNPMFGDAGLFSYLIKVYREENDRIFNYAASLDSVEEAKLSFKLEIGTDVFAEGDVKVTESNDNEIEFYLKSGNSSVNYFLKNTLMNQTEIWGNHDNLYTEENTLEGCFPEFKIVAPPIGNADGVVYNYYDFASVLHNDNKYPAVYVRLLLNKLISGLGYTKESDCLNDIADFNRLALFSPVHKKGEYPNSKISSLLPAVSLLDWVSDFRTRFSIAVFFSPYLYDAEILNIADCLNLDPVNWTNKYKSISKLAPPAEKQLYFSHDSEEKNNVLEYQVLKDNYGYYTVATMAEMTQGNTYYFVTSLDRFFFGEITTPDSLTTNNPGYHFRSDNISFGGKTYKSIVEAYLFDYSDTIVNSDTTANTLNLIDQFMYPLWDGELNYSWGYSIDAKTTAAAKLVVKLVGIDEDGNETECGHDEVDITSTSYIKITRKLRASASVTLSSETNANYRLALRFYCKAETAGTQITMQYGGLEYGTGDEYESEGYINPQMTEFKEVGIIGNLTYGDIPDNEKPTNYKPTSKIPVNDLFQMNHYLFEFPKTNIEPKDRDEQTDFEYIIYRGKKADIQQGIKYAGYCNADILDQLKEDYTNKLETPLEPLLSLAWIGEKGILNKLWKNRLHWERYFKREAKINMELSINDIMNHKIYIPFSIKENHFIIDELDFELDEMGNVSNCQITPYTL